MADQFEIHLTLDAAQAEDCAAGLTVFANERELALLQIELPRGASVIAGV